MSIRELSIWRSLDCWSARSCWLWAWTASPFRSGSDSRIRVMFAEIEEIIGLALPPSCRKHPAHWSAYGRAPSTGAIQDAGRSATGVNLEQEDLVLMRRAW